MSIKNTEKENKNYYLTPLFSEALQWAAQLHAGQCRKGTKIPYISHLLAVSATVLETAGEQENCEEPAIAALLHDAAEDQGGKQTLDKIRHKFGNAVADIVEACSDTLEIKKPEWKERKEKYLKQLKDDKSEDAKIVSLADKLHNARAISLDYSLEGEDLWERFNGNKEEILWYYRELADIFTGTNFTNKKAQLLAAQLEHTVKHIETMAKNAGT